MYINYAYLSIYMERRESPTHGSENSHCLNNMSIITIPVNVSIGTEEILQVLPGRRTMSQWLLRDGSSGWGQKKKKRWIIKVRAKLKHRDSSVLVPASHAHVSTTNLLTHGTRGTYGVFLVLMPEATTNIFCSAGSSETSLPFKPILKVNKIKLIPKEGGIKDFTNHSFSKVKHSSIILPHAKYIHHPILGNLSAISMWNPTCSRTNEIEGWRISGVSH